ncbi:MULTISPECIES: aspartate/glutamate racemase family protein [unclassified Bradyrhizobium]|uniref:maleate cis-trans isomerase family protein n=1 Tax=unclassified Bradyrhizobium TaxID=2631580 RepID=UPI001605876C|nr:MULTISPECIES: aspartate/glutamate racemase family protein [unclassified Bradyrhizobium]MBB4262837.1 maleate isomerase [Bradyrhizobium sp. CIR3A]MBB4360704.1 maleate isomerase [Bradyrhizobium sp. CIR18]MBB4393680.1 maleate isomerase [Bradyrhizobium sp. ERR14]MBB4429617.1 maleate isomerase [Bradyrhizobium sp. CIR48]
MRKRLGMITPSSNSVLEPVTSAMLAGVPGVTAHFSRFRVTEIALDATALSQFDASAMLPAADLLADAKVDAIAWNGTSASWLGIGRDRSLCEAITARTSVPATTSTLACIEATRALGAKRIGLVSPYTDDVQRRIGDVWAEAGVAPHAERHLRLRDNFSFGEVAPATIADMIRAVASEGADAIVILCTNLDGAALATALERELDIAVLDSVAVTLWRTLCLAGGDLSALAQWGRIFQTMPVIK